MAPKRKRSTTRRSSAKRATAPRATSAFKPASKVAEAEAKFSRSAASRATTGASRFGAMENPFTSSQNPFASMFNMAAENSEKLTKSFGAMGNMGEWGNAAAAWSNPFQAAKSTGEKTAKKANGAMKDIISASTGEAQKVQEKIFSMSREGVEHVQRSADAASRSLNEAMAMSQGNIEACVECGTIAADISKAMSEEVYNFANEMFSQNVELSKEIFTCRTLNDMFELQSKIFKSNIDGVFNETAKISEMAFHMATKAAEPISDRFADATERLTRTIAA